MVSILILLFIFGFLFLLFCGVSNWVIMVMEMWRIFVRFLCGVLYVVVVVMVILKFVENGRMGLCLFDFVLRWYMDCFFLKKFFICGGFFLFLE